MVSNPHHTDMGSLDEDECIIPDSITTSNPDRQRIGIPPGTSYVSKNTAEAGQHYYKSRNITNHSRCNECGQKITPVTTIQEAIARHAIKYKNSMETTELLNSD